MTWIWIWCTKEENNLFFQAEAKSLTLPMMFMAVMKHDRLWKIGVTFFAASVNCEEKKKQLPTMMVCASSETYCISLS